MLLVRLKVSIILPKTAFTIFLNIVKIDCVVISGRGGMVDAPA